MSPTSPEGPYPMSGQPVDFALILEAQRRIAPHALHTPMLQSAEGDLWLKCENRQRTGSFKVRGALNKILGLGDNNSRAGVVAASAGNHGQGVAYAASLRGLSATIVVPQSAVPRKVDAIEAMGGVAVKAPGGYAVAEQLALRLAHAQGAAWVSPYNDPQVVAGQGTVGIEVAEDLPLEDGLGWTVYVPAGGAGLVSGIGVALKHLAHRVRVVAVQPRTVPYLFAHFHGQDMSTVVEEPTLADGLAGAIEPGSITLSLVDEVVDDVALVEEEEILQAIVWSAQVI